MGITRDRHPRLKMGKKGCFITQPIACYTKEKLVMLYHKSKSNPFWINTDT